MIQRQQNVIIKGTKDGFRLILDDQCSYDELLQEIDEKLSVNTRQNDDDRLVPVFLEIGNRYLDPEQEQSIKDLIRRKKNLVVEQIDSNVITKSEAEELHKVNRIVSVARMVRSGQILDITGDLLLLGDVNPGGKVIATGNIFVMGVLRGAAHAGSNGNVNAVIAASSMKPSQLGIADVISRAPDFATEDEHVMECAYIDKDNKRIMLDRIQALSWLRNSLTRL